MAKLARTARSQVPRIGSVPRTNTTTPDTRTHQGGKGFSKDAKTELFTLAVANFVGEDTFYEDGKVRDRRFIALINQVTKEDPAWVAKMLTWLRTEGNMRSASIVGAIEYGRALANRADVDLDVTPRKVLASVLQRADEPAEALGYWVGSYGRPVPKWLTRALGDSAALLYTPFSALKYDTHSAPIRFGDVIEMSQKDGDMKPLWKWLIDRGKGREEGDYGIEMLRARQVLNAQPVKIRRAMIESGHPLKDGDTTITLQDAGYTWESLSGWIQGAMDAKVWEAAIPSMGHMALLRNLRNFDEAGVSDAVAQKVIDRITDPAKVASSRQLPFRFYRAYTAAPSDRWKHALGIALDLSLASIPSLPGRSLVLIDTSGSMGQTLTNRGQTTAWQHAALFGLAFARGQADSADIYGFDSTHKHFTLTKGSSTLSEMVRFGRTVHGGATYTQRAVASTFKPGLHKRVVVLTDQQASYDWNMNYPYERYGLGQHGPVAGGVFDAVPESVPCYTFDVTGAAAGHDKAGTTTRRLVAGLTDSAFQMMQVMEARYGRGQWPWEISG